MKKLVEYKDGEVWRQVNVEVAYSHNNNYWFKHNGVVYVFPLLKEGTEVVMKSGKNWIKVGRVARSCIFLGEGLSFSETNEEKFKNETKWEKPIFT